MFKTLKAFWIYWGLLVSGCIVFFLYPLLFIVILPMLLVLIPIWIIVVYLIGNAVQRKSSIEKTSRRIVLSLLCSFFTVLIFPVCSWVNDIVTWKKLYLDSFLGNFSDMSFWIMFVIHFLAFWAGEEIEHLTAIKKESA